MIEPTIRAVIGRTALSVSRLSAYGVTLERA